MARVHFTMIPVFCTLFPCFSGELSICPRADMCNVQIVQEPYCQVSSTSGSCTLQSFRYPDFTLFFKPEEGFETLDIEIYSLRCASFIGSLQVLPSSLQLGEWHDIKLRYEEPRYSVIINGENGSEAIEHHMRVLRFGKISVPGSFFRVQAQGKFAWSFSCDPRAEKSTHAAVWVLLTLLLILVAAFAFYCVKKCKIFTMNFGKEDERELHPSPRRPRFSLARAWSRRLPPPVDPTSFTAQTSQDSTRVPSEHVYEEVNTAMATGVVNHHPDACRSTAGQGSSRDSSYSVANSTYGEL